MLLWETRKRPCSGLWAWVVSKGWGLRWWQAGGQCFPKPLPAKSKN